MANGKDWWQSMRIAIIVEGKTEKAFDSSLKEFLKGRLAADAKQKMREWVGTEPRFFPHAACHDFEAWLAESNDSSTAVFDDSTWKMIDPAKGMSS